MRGSGYMAEDEVTRGLDEEDVEESLDLHVVDLTPDKTKRPSTKVQSNSAASVDDASVAMAPAGVANLQQQKISGKDRIHQLRYYVCFFVPPSKEADKTMIAAAIKSSPTPKKWMTPS